MDSNSDGISGDVSSGRLNRTGARSVQMDRDTIFTAQFRQMLTHSDREVKQTPPQQPWKNGHIERFVQTLKNLVLRKVFCLSELYLPCLAPPVLSNRAADLPAASGSPAFGREVGEFGSW